MFIKIVESNDENKMLNEIIKIIGKERYIEIEKEINEYCDACKIDSAISFASCYGLNWSNKKMQVVYDKLQDYNKAAQYAGIIFKEVIKKNNGRFEIVKGKKGINLYYKRA